MSSQYEQLRTHFDGLNTVQKKQFIDKLKAITNKGEMHTHFINECEEKYNLAISDDSTQELAMNDYDELLHIGDDDFDSEENKIGNSNSNLSNTGLVVSKNNWVYFSNCNLGIYKMKTDGSEKEKLNDDGALFLNLVGDYLYYIGNGQNIVKMKTDGSEKETIYNKRCLFASVIGEWIYFVELLEGAYHGYVCKIKTDGSSYTKLSKNKYSSRLNVQGDWIYYIDEDPSKDWDNQNKPYKIKTDGTEEQKFNNESCGFSSCFIATDECVYQSTYDEMMKISHDGVVIKKITLPDDFYSACVQDDWIYYFGDGNMVPILKMKLDGSSNRKIIDTRYNNSKLFVCGDWVYYTEEKGKIDKCMILCRIKTDATEKEECGQDLPISTDISIDVDLYDEILDKLNAASDEFTKNDKSFMNILKQYQYSEHQTTLPHTATEYHLSEVSSLSKSANALVNEMTEAKRKIARLMKSDTDKQYTSELKDLENQADYNKDYASDSVKRFNQFIDWQKSLKKQVEQIEREKNKTTLSKKSSSNDTGSGLATAALGLGAALLTGATKTMYKPAKRTPRIKHTSGTKTGIKHGR